MESERSNGLHELFRLGSQEHPIDGGVFNITANNQDVPIDPKILVGNRPVQFAITIEKPGGVVVSERKELPLLANQLASN